MRLVSIVSSRSFRKLQTFSLNSCGVEREDLFDSYTRARAARFLSGREGGGGGGTRLGAGGGGGA